jgi:Uma2 family endonuclease
MVPTFPMIARMMAHARDTVIGRHRNMHMALKTHRWTRADLERLPDDGNKYEVIHGELFVSPAPDPAHDFIKNALAERLIPFCHTQGLLHVFVGSAFVEYDSETRPDIIVSGRTMPPPDRWDDMPTPALAVEVLSDSTRRRDLVTKRAFYLESGIAEYWIVDGEARTIRVITPTDDRVEASALHWTPVGATGTLALDVRELFEKAIGPRAP